MSVGDTNHARVGISRWLLVALTTVPPTEEEEWAGERAREEKGIQARQSGLGSNSDVVIHCRFLNGSSSTCRKVHSPEYPFGNARVARDYSSSTTFKEPAREAAIMNENMITEEVFRFLARNLNFLDFRTLYQENMITEEVFRFLARNLNFLDFRTLYQENMITEEVFRFLARNLNFLDFRTLYQENMITEEVFRFLARNLNFLDFRTLYQENMITEEVFRFLARNLNFLDFRTLYQENMITEEVFRFLARNLNFLDFRTLYQENMITEEIILLFIFLKVRFKGKVFK
ncbi:hypothetical protein EAI_05577 [Harpegnathos saltator]|uniref:Uncharacterized protein n=1 Tax=Harpegnathos saltator TaxID=610380 RepID=E2C769_HARSA|nr:hypothetical protein EAI_05577 [Harpegnathos saltator]